jgi:hypothetical protein
MLHSVRKKHAGDHRPQDSIHAINLISELCLYLYGCGWPRCNSTSKGREIRRLTPPEREDHTREVREREKKKERKKKEREIGRNLLGENLPASGEARGTWERPAITRET